MPCFFSRLQRHKHDLNHDVKCWCLGKKMLGGSRQLSPKADLWSAERITGLWKESRLIRKSEGCKMYEYVYVGLYVPCVSKSFRCLQSNMLPEVAWSPWKFVKIMEDQCVLTPQIWVVLGVNVPPISICTKKTWCKISETISLISLDLPFCVCVWAWIAYTGLCACLKTPVPANLSAWCMQQELKTHIL